MFLPGLGSAFSRVASMSLTWVTPTANATLPLGTPVHVKLTANRALDSATFVVNNGAPTTMVVPPRTGLRIAILGQSNAEGIATDSPPTAIPGIAYDEAISPSPVGWPGNVVERLGETTISVRPDNAHGIEFGLVSTLQLAGYTVASVAKYGVGSSNLSDLAADACWLPAAAELYPTVRDWLLARQAGYGDVIDVVVWLQGEGDAQTQAQSLAYDVNLHALTTQLRTDLGNPNLIVVVPRLNASCNRNYLANVRSQVALWEARNPVLNRLTDTDAIAMAPDALHYLSVGYAAIGQGVSSRTAKTLELMWTPSAGDDTTDLLVSGTQDTVTKTTTRIVAVPDQEAAALVAIKALGSGVDLFTWTGDGSTTYGHEDVGNVTAGIQWDEWLDQSVGGTNDLTQTTDANQPTLTAEGTGYGLLCVAASNQGFTLPAAILSGKSAFTIAVCAAQTDNVGTKMWLVGDGTDIQIRSATNNSFRFQIGNLQNGVLTTPMGTALRRLIWRFDGSQLDNLTRLRVWYDGTEVTGSLTYTGTIPATVPALTSLSLGQDALPMGGKYYILAIWDEALSAENCATLDTHLITLLDRLS